MFASVAGKRPASETFEVVHKKKETCQSHSIMRVGRRRRSQMLRTVASPGIFGCHDCRFFHKCTEVTDKADTLRIVVHPPHLPTGEKAPRLPALAATAFTGGKLGTPARALMTIGKIFFFPHKKVKKQPKNYTKKTGNFLDWDFGIWPKRDGFRDILDHSTVIPHYNYPTPPRSPPPLYILVQKTQVHQVQRIFQYYLVANLFGRQVSCPTVYEIENSTSLIIS